MFWTMVFILNTIALSEFFVKPVYAYIDPSAVTYVIQAVAGVVIAIGACLTIFRHKIAAFFKKRKKEEGKKEIHFNEEIEDTVDTAEKNND